MTDEFDEAAALRAENERLRAELAAKDAGPPPPQPSIISPGAPVQSGRKMGTSTKWFLGIVAVFFVLIVAMCATGNKGVKSQAGSAAPAAADAKPDAGKTADADAKPAAKAEDAAPPEKETAWRYDSSEDPMGGVTKTACVESIDQVSLSFPYHDQHMQLCLRRSPKFGLDAYASLESDGQILCSSYSRCHIRVRFDDKPAVAWSGADAADGSSNIVFLTRTAALVGRIKTAKRLRLELEFYQAGDQTVEFPVEGLKW